jgi:hypothetical protein
MLPDSAVQVVRQDWCGAGKFGESDGATYGQETRAAASNGKASGP